MTGSHAKRAADELTKRLMSDPSLREQTRQHGMRVTSALNAAGAMAGKHLADGIAKGAKEAQMPVKSRKQAGLIGMVAAGKKKLPGLSRSQAKEMLRGQSVKKLPTRAKRRKR